MIYRVLTVLGRDVSARSECLAWDSSTDHHIAPWDAWHSAVSPPARRPTSASQISQTSASTAWPVAARLNLASQLHKQHRLWSRSKHSVCHDVTCPRWMGGIFETDPEIRSTPAGTIISYSGALQKLGTVSWTAVLMDTRQLSVLFCVDWLGVLYGLAPCRLSRNYCDVTVSRESVKGSVQCTNIM